MPLAEKKFFQNRPPKYFKLGADQILIIKKYINNNFDSSNEKYPLAICYTCKLTLTELKNKGENIVKRPLPCMPNYEDVVLTKQTRQVTVCDCYICFTARCTSHSKVKKGRGKIKQFPTIDVIKVPDSTVDKSCSKVSKDRTSLEICRHCFQEIGKGISHSCKGADSSNVRDNICKLV